MMKVLVFSDSHGITSYMQQAVDRERPDRILHLGDVVQDAQALARANPELPLEYVSGNCDTGSGVPQERLLELGCKRVLMTHGHCYQVKRGMELAVQAARAAGAGVLLFGHTHVDFVGQEAGLWVMNPGSIRGLGRTTYGVLLLEEKGTTCYTASIQTI